MSLFSRILHSLTNSSSSTESSVVVTLAATLTFAGIVYYNFVYRTEDSNNDNSDFAVGDPYW
jgi:hypothetical protein